MADTEPINQAITQEGVETARDITVAVNEENRRQVMVAGYQNATNIM